MGRGRFSAQPCRSAADKACHTAAFVQHVHHPHLSHRCTHDHDHVDPVRSQARHTSADFTQQPLGAVAHDCRADFARGDDPKAEGVGEWTWSEHKHEVFCGDADPALLDANVVGSKADAPFARPGELTHTLLAGIWPKPRLGHTLLLVDGGRKPMSSLTAAVGEDLATGGGLVSRTKAVRAQAALVMRLVGSLRHDSAPLKGRAL